MTLQAAFDALETEAGNWDKTSGEISQATQAVAGLTLGPSDFGWGGGGSGLTATYGQVQAHIGAYLDGGVTETAKLADTLRQVSGDFQSTDQNVVADMRANWVPE